MRKTSGISLMLLIFLSLCLITFSLLSLSGAAADEKLSRKAADRTTEYYKAASSANAVLADIDGLLAGYLKSTRTASEPESTYLQLCSEIPDVLSEPDLTWTEGTLSFTVPVTDDQILQVKLQISYPADDANPLYHISNWEVVNTRDWTPDNSQHLFQGLDIE